MSRALHHAIAERGKVLALEGDHVSAMMHFREAMSLAVSQGVPEVSFRHYMDCALESLERLGELEEVIRYCTRALEHYEQHPPEHELARLDLASIHQRHGVVLLKSGRDEEAREALTRAMQQVDGDRAALPIAHALLRWLDARMHVSPTRLEAELGRHRYYTVRKGNVRGPGPLADAVSAAMSVRQGI